MINGWHTAFTSSTKLSANPTSITTAQSTTLTATVAGGTPPGYGSKVPALTGSVNFIAGSTQVGKCTLSGGTCSASVAGTALTVGSNSVTATFVGSGTYPSSTSSVVTVTVTSTQTTPTLTLTASSTAIEAGQTLSYTAAVNVGTGTAATGSVTISDQQGTVGTVQLSNGSFSGSTQAFTTPGTYTFKAHYSGDGTYPPLDAQPLTVVVRAFPFTLQLVGSSTIKAGTPFSYKVIIGDGKGPTLMGYLGFYASINGGAIQQIGSGTINGSQLINGDELDGTYTISTPGTYTVYAGYGNDVNYGTQVTQTPVNFTVQ
jgi:hypothetical protein